MNPTQSLQEKEREKNGLLSKEFGSRMSEHCFHGDIAAFQEVFAEYLAKQSEVDPFGRLLLHGQVNRHSLLAFRSTQTSIDHTHAQLKLRMSAWMSVFPLDMQINLLIMENSPRVPQLIDFQELKWGQWWDILASNDPSSTFDGSALKHPAPLDDLNDEGSWLRLDKRLTSLSQCHAMQLMSLKSWESLRSWMDASKLHAKEEMEAFYVHYVDEHSRGSTSATARHGNLPFWMSGLFTGASEPDFWSVMHRFGGPSTPSEMFSEIVDQSPPPSITQNARRGPTCRLVSCPPAVQWGDPLEWVIPRAPLSPAAVNSMTSTASSWMRDAMAASAPHAALSKKSTPRL